MRHDFVSKIILRKTEQLNRKLYKGDARISIRKRKKERKKKAPRTFCVEQHDAINSSKQIENVTSFCLEPLRLLFSTSKDLHTIFYYLCVVDIKRPIGNITRKNINNHKRGSAIMHIFLLSF